MKDKILLFLVGTILLISGCSSTGDIKFINNTEHNVYINADNKDIILQGKENYKMSIDTGEQFLFTDNTKRIKVIIDGETYCLENNTPFTYLDVTANKTTTAYFAPISASLKIFNNSGKTLKSLFFTQHFDDGTTSPSGNILSENIEDGDSAYFRILQSSIDNHFYYTFTAKFADNSIIHAGDETTVLGLDEQYIWEMN